MGDDDFEKEVGKIHIDSTIKYDCSEVDDITLSTDKITLKVGQTLLLQPSSEAQQMFNKNGSKKLVFNNSSDFDVIARTDTRILLKKKQQPGSPIDIFWENESFRKTSLVVSETLTTPSPTLSDEEREQAIENTQGSIRNGLFWDQQKEENDILQTTTHVLALFLKNDFDGAQQYIRIENRILTVDPQKAFNEYSNIVNSSFKMEQMKSGITPKIKSGISNIQFIDHDNAIINCFIKSSVTGNGIAFNASAIYQDNGWKIDFESFMIGLNDALQ
jgi:hypothetical protein